MKRFIKRIFTQLRAQSGSSLIETLVALAILGSIGTVYMSAISTGSRTSERLDKKATAERLVRNQLEDIKSAPYDDSAPYQYPVVDYPANYSIAIDVEANAENTLQDITVKIFHQGVTLITMDTYKVEGL